MKERKPIPKEVLKQICGGGKKKIVGTSFFDINKSADKDKVVLITPL